MDFKSKPLGATHFVVNRYCGKGLWGIGYGAWSTGNITEEVVEKYLNAIKAPQMTKAISSSIMGLSVPTKPMHFQCIVV
jgi:hypothetical protein